MIMLERVSLDFEYYQWNKVCLPISAEAILLYADSDQMTDYWNLISRNGKSYENKYEE